GRGESGCIEDLARGVGELLEKEVMPRYRARHPDLPDGCARGVEHLDASAALHHDGFDERARHVPRSVGERESDDGSSEIGLPERPLLAEGEVRKERDTVRAGLRTLREPEDLR